MCSNEKQIRLELAKQRCLQCLYSGSRLLSQLCPQRCSERRNPSCEIPFFPLPVHLLPYLWGHQPFRGVVCTPAGSWAGQCLLAGPCCADRALHNPCSRCQPISQPISPQLQLLPNLCKGRRSDFSCDIFVGSPGGCRQPSQTVT